MSTTAIDRELSGKTDERQKGGQSEADNALVGWGQLNSMREGY